METTANGWVVLDREAGVLTNAYVFDGKTSTANAFVARLADGKLLVVSPTFRASSGMFEDLGAFGEVGALVANNGFHHLGQAEWKQRYPQARCFAPVDAMPRIAKKNRKAPQFEPLSELHALLGPDVGVVEAANTKCGESWVWANTRDGCAWFVSDLLANMPELPANFVVRQLFKWTGSAPGFRPFNLAMKFTLEDKRAVLRALAKDLDAHPPTIVVPAHGGILSHAGLASETRQLVASALD